MGLGKISIARRRLEVRNSEDGHQELPHRSSETFSLLQRSSVADSKPTAVPDIKEGLVFQLPEQHAQRLEAMAMPAHDGEGILTAAVQRKGSVLILRLESPAHARKLLSCDQVAEMLGMSRRYVYHQARDLKLPAYRFGRTLRFDPKDVIQFLASRALEDRRS